MRRTCGYFPNNPLALSLTSSVKLFLAASWLAASGMVPGSAVFTQGFSPAGRTEVSFMT